MATATGSICMSATAGGELGRSGSCAHGKARELGLGPYPAVSLPAAREKAFAMRQNLAAGRQVRTPATATFASVARAYIKTQSPAWHNAKHAAQWSATLEAYAFPVIGHLPVDRIETSHVLAILAPIWTSKNETASRVRGRIEAVLDAARVQGLRPDGTNPAAWRNHLDKILPGRSRTRIVKHHAALSFMATKALFARLASVEGEAARALRFTILTAARTGEVLGATWREIDRDVWTIPAARMKAGRGHRVPLTGAALAILGERGAGFVFQGKGREAVEQYGNGDVLAPDEHFRDRARLPLDLPGLGG